MLHLLFWCFQSIEVLEESAKTFTRVWHNLSEKRHLSQLISSNWIQTKVCIALLKPSLLCFKGSRIVCRQSHNLKLKLYITHTYTQTYTRTHTHSRENINWVMITKKS